VVNTENRCGTSELDARENCRQTCDHSGECPSGTWCWGVHANYCGSVPQKNLRQSCSEYAMDPMWGD
jgi:hypothetical protein